GLEGGGVGAASVSRGDGRAGRRPVPALEGAPRMTSSDAQAIDLRTAADADVEAAQDLPAVLGPGDVIMLVTDSAAGLESRPITCAEVLPTGIRCLIDQTAS